VAGCCECGDEPLGSGATELGVFSMWFGISECSDCTNNL
jgi:hypothetical protein